MGHLTPGAYPLWPVLFLLNTFLEARINLLSAILSNKMMRSLFISRKKGMATQVDWAISLAIFLVFTFWFFIVLRQISSPELRMESTVEEIAQRFKDSVAFEYNQIPIYAIADEDISHAPILARNPTNWTRFVLEEELFSARHGEFLYFMANLTEGTNLFMMRSSEREYDVSAPSEFISKSSDMVTVPSVEFNARFPDNILEEIHFEDVQQLFGMNAYIDGQTVEFENATEHTPGHLVEHNMTADLFRLRSYAFPENRFLMNMVDFGTIGGDITLSLEFVLPMHEFYHLDPVVPYSLSNFQDCIEEESKMIDLVDPEGKGIAFAFREPVLFEMCDISTIQQQDRMTLTAHIPYSPSERRSSRRFVIYSHDAGTPGRLEGILDLDSVHVGARERFVGISGSRLLELRSMDDEELLDLWGIPEDVDFSIDVYDKEEKQLFFFRSSDPRQSDVFSRTFRDFLIDEHGEREFVNVNVNIW